MSKKTPWFDGSVKPVRDGVYERLYDKGTALEQIENCTFQNGVWIFRGGTSALQDVIPWRGLARKP